MVAFRPRLFALLVGLALALSGMSAYAGLGHPLSQAPQDGQPVTQVQRFTAKATSGASAESTPAVQSQTLQTPQGVTVTEYADAAGVVFAVTWKGPFKPDLQQLLGSYFSPYVDAAKSQTQQLNLSLVTGSDIVVHSAGRMRGFLGVAWVPSLVPAGFDPSTLQP